MRSFTLFQNCIFICVVVPYFFGVKGGSCTDGAMIMDKQECKNACNYLNIAHGTMRNQKACYLAKNGKCRQDGKHRIGISKTDPICKNTGKLRSKTILTQITIFKWSCCLRFNHSKTYFSCLQGFRVRKRY